MSNPLNDYVNANRKEYMKLGQIMVAEIGLAACVEAYDSDNLAIIGRCALGWGDIDEDGELN